MQRTEKRSHHVEDIATLAGSAVLIALLIVLAYLCPDALSALAHK